MLMRRTSAETPDALNEDAHARCAGGDDAHDEGDGRSRRLLLRQQQPQQHVRYSSAFVGKTAVYFGT